MKKRGIVVVQQCNAAGTVRSRCWSCSRSVSTVVDGWVGSFVVDPFPFFTTLLFHRVFRFWVRTMPEFRDILRSSLRRLRREILLHGLYLRDQPSQFCKSAKMSTEVPLTIFLEASFSHVVGTPSTVVDRPLSSIVHCVAFAWPAAIASKILLIIHCTSLAS